MSNPSDFVIENGVLNRYKGAGGDVAVPEGVSKIGDTAFYGCTGLQSIMIPEGITEIETCGFCNCSGLKTVSLPSTLTKLGSSAFSGCSSLSSIVLPEACSEIGYKAFYECSSLKEIIVKGTITKVGEDAFTGCRSLTNVLLDPALITEIDSKIKAALSWINAPDVLRDATHKEETLKYAFSKKKRFLQTIFDNDMVLALHTFAENGKITKKNVDEEFLNPALNAHATHCAAFLMDWKASNTTAKDAAKKIERDFTKDPFNATDMKKLWSTQKLDDGTLEITSYKGNEMAIVIPNRIGNTPISRIGDYALSPEKVGRSKLQCEPLLKISSIEISEGITKIGRGSFQGCKGLVAVTLPDSLKHIDYLSFANCVNLSQINLSDHQEIYGGAFSACRSLADADGFFILRGSLQAYAGTDRTLTIPDGVRSIDYRAFCDNKSLVSVKIPSDVGYIGHEAFEGCSALEEVRIEGSCVFIGGNAFRYCRRLRAVYVPKGSTTESYARNVSGKIKTF